MKTPHEDNQKNTDLDFNLDDNACSSLKHCSEDWPNMGLEEKALMLQSVFRDKFSGVDKNIFIQAASKIIFPDKDTIQARAIIQAILGTRVNRSAPATFSQADDYDAVKTEAQRKVLEIDQASKKKPVVKQNFPVNPKKPVSPPKPKKKSAAEIKEEKERADIIKNEHSDRGFRILASEWDGLGESDRALKLYHLMRLNPFNFKAKAKERLGLSENEINTKISKGRRLFSVSKMKF